MAREMIGGIGSVLIGSSYLFMAMRLRTSALADTVGPAGFPKALAFAMIALGVILCVQALLAGGATWRTRLDPATKTARAEAVVSDEEGAGGLRSVFRAGGMLLLGIGYLLIVRYFGYIVSVALLMLASALYLGTPFSWRVPVIGVAGALVYWLVFVWLLGIPLPAGMFAELF